MRSKLAEEIRLPIRLVPRIIGALVAFFKSASEYHRGTDVVVVISFVGFIFEHNVQLILQIRLLSFSNQQVTHMTLGVWLLVNQLWSGLLPWNFRMPTQWQRES